MLLTGVRKCLLLLALAWAYTLTPALAAHPDPCPLVFSEDNASDLRYGRMPTPEEIDQYELSTIYELLGVLDLDLVVKQGDERAVLRSINEQTLAEAAVLQGATALALFDLKVRDEAKISKFLKELPTRDPESRERFLKRVQNHAEHLLGLDIAEGADKELNARARELRDFYGPLSTELASIRMRWISRRDHLGREATVFLDYLSLKTSHFDGWTTLLRLEMESIRKGKIRSTIAHKMEFLAWAATDPRPPRPRAASLTVEDVEPRVRVRSGFLGHKTSFVRKDIREAAKQIRSRERIVAGTVGGFIGSLEYLNSMGHGMSTPAEVGWALAATALGYAVVGINTAGKDLSWIVGYLRGLPNAYTVDDIQYFVDRLPPTYRMVISDFDDGTVQLDGLSHLSILAMARKLALPPTLSEFSWLLKRLSTSTNQRLLVRGLSDRFPNVDFSSMLNALKDRRGKDWVRVVDGQKIRYFPREAAIEARADENPERDRYRIVPELDRPVELPESELDAWQEQFDEIHQNEEHR